MEDGDCKIDCVVLTSNESVEDPVAGRPVLAESSEDCDPVVENRGKTEVGRDSVGESESIENVDVDKGVDDGDESGVGGKGVNEGDGGGVDVDKYLDDNDDGIAVDVGKNVDDSDGTAVDGGKDSDDDFGATIDVDKNGDGDGIALDVDENIDDGEGITLDINENVDDDDDGVAVTALDIRLDGRDADVGNADTADSTVLGRMVVAENREEKRKADVEDPALAKMEPVWLPPSVPDKVTCAE